MTGITGIWWNGSFYHGFGNKTRVLMFAQHPFYPMSHILITLAFTIFRSYSLTIIGIGMLDISDYKFL